MTLTELKYVLAVTREKHFSRAAEACFVSQPTLSVAVKKPEEELKVMLFEHGGGESRAGGCLASQQLRVDIKIIESIRLNSAVDALLFL